MLTKDLLEMVAEQWLGAVTGAEESGCDLISFCGGRALDLAGVRDQTNKIYDLVSPETLNGLVVWTSLLSVTMGRDALVEYCRLMNGRPVVSVEESVDGGPVILMDNRGGMRAVVSHLIEVHGSRRIAFIRGAAGHVGARERYEGYRDALREHGLSEDPALVSDETSSWTAREAADAVTAILRGELLPDAIAAANDDFAVAVLSALAEGPGNLDIPVVGFDDVTDVRTQDLGFQLDDVSGGSVRRVVNINAESLSLTTVRAPFRELGRRAVQTVAAMVRGDRVPDVVIVPTEVVVRRSCGCRPSPDESSGFDQAAKDLRPLLRGRSPALPEDWPERLTSALTAELLGTGNGVFPRLLDGLVRESMRAGEDIESWWRVLYALRHQVSGGAVDRAVVDDVMLHAELLVNEIAARHWHYAKVLAEKRNQIVREVGQRLIMATDVAEVAAALAEELPKVGIPGCYVASYEPGDQSRAHAKLLLAYESGAPVEVPPGSAVFDSVRLVPGDLLHRDRPSSMVVVPLAFKDQQLGFALIELGPRIGWIYAALQEQLSSALHRAFLVERERAALDAVEEAHRREERHRLAAELHDSVSQALFSMTLQTRAVELAVQQQGGPLENRISRGLTELRSLTQGALAEMRALIFQLRPEVLREEGLVAAIRRHAAAVAARDEFGVYVEAPGDRLPLAEDAEQELFRIVQEALHNCTKHAHPNRVDIRIDTPGGNALLVEIADDGVGFDPDLPRPGHLGLIGMRERTERLGGRFGIDSAPGKPTTVRAELPDVLQPGEA